MAIQKIFTSDDNVFATLVGNGKIIKTVMDKNFTNLSQVVKKVCSGCDYYNGLAELIVRNQSQGWSLNMLLTLNNVIPKLELHDIEPPRDGLQYRFAF